MAMTAMTFPAPSPLATDAPTITLRTGALLHRVRSAAAAVWRLAPGRYLAHVVVHGGRANRRYDVSFKVTP